MNIRPATVSDARAIATIAVTTWRAAYRGQMPDELLDGLDVDVRETFWRGILAGSHATTVAEEGDSVTAFCSVIPARDADAAGTAELAALYVLPERWRCGAGRALCEGCFKDAAGAGYAAMMVWVLASNAASIRFYEAMEFMADGTTKSEAGAGGFPLDQLRMRRSLAGFPDLR